MKHQLFKIKNATLVAVFLALLALSPCYAQTDDTSEEADNQIASLVKQLGAKTFSARESAMRTLFELGLPAVPHLREVTEHRDREVRQRSRRILQEIALRDRPRRLAILIAGTQLADLDSSATSFGIPGLEKLTSVAGDSAETRYMLALALRSNWELIESAARRSPKSLALIEQACTNARTNEAATDGGVKPGTVAAIITGAVLRDQTLPDRIAIQVYSLMSQMDRESTRLSSKGDTAWSHEPFRRLVGAFILSADGPTAVYQGLKVTMEHDLPEGLALSERIVRGGYALPHIRQFAILGLARFGDESHIADLQQLLDDNDVCFTRRQSGSRSNFECQIRDLAMASILHVVGEDPREFGFRRIQTSDQFVYQPHTVGFDTHEDREAARAKFHVLFAGNLMP